MVSKEVLNNPVKFNDAILDKPNKDYAQWILKMESWGGAIEIGIISDALAVAIYVVDIDAVKIEKFNEDKFDNYILILFNGIHYDSLTMNEFKTVFNKNQPESDDVLTCRACCINESANARGEAVCVLGALPLPRSLTRCARSFGCGERYQLTQRR